MSLPPRPSRCRHISARERVRPRAADEDVIAGAPAEVVLAADVAVADIFLIWATTAAPQDVVSGTAVEDLGARIAPEEEVVAFASGARSPHVTLCNDTTVHPLPAVITAR